MDREKIEKKYEGLSPFELKSKLIDMAGGLREKVMLTVWGALIVNFL